MDSRRQKKKQRKKTPKLPKIKTNKNNKTINKDAVFFSLQHLIQCWHLGSLLGPHCPAFGPVSLSRTGAMLGA